MITCRKCGSLSLECIARLFGSNLHTKVQDDGSVLVVPEYYVLEDDGDTHELKCHCNEPEIIFMCDYCRNHINSKKVDIVKRKREGHMVICKRCLNEIGNFDEHKEVKIEEIEIIIDADQQVDNRNNEDR